MRLGRVALVPVADCRRRDRRGALIPRDSLREPLETAVSRALQREVQIRGICASRSSPNFLRRCCRAICE